MKVPNPDPELVVLLEHAPIVTPEEIEAQRQSWIRGEMALGTDADESEFRTGDLQ